MSDHSAIKYGDPPRRWSSNDPVEDVWEHGHKSRELWTLISICRRRKLFVRKVAQGKYTISQRDVGPPRIHLIERATYDECMTILETFPITP